MSEQEMTKERALQKRELVALSEAASLKINQWIEQINAKKTVNLSRKAFLSWYLENALENLSNGEVNAAIEKFYDAESHLRQLLRDVQKAKASGQTSAALDLVLRIKKTDTKKDSLIEQIPPASD